MRRTKKRMLSIIFNLILILTELRAIQLSFFDGSKRSWEFLKFYTQDCNIFLLITSVVYVFELIRCIIMKKEVSKVVHIFRFASIGAALTTFLIVGLIFTPILMDLSSYVGSSFYFHFLCPLLGVITFYLFDEGCMIKLTHINYSFFFTLGYAIVLPILVGFNIVTPPYPFLDVENNHFMLSVLYALAVPFIAYVVLVFIKFTYNILNFKRIGNTVIE